MGRRHTGYQMRSPTSWNSLLSPGDATDYFSRRPFPPFDPTADDFSSANALWLAELSRLVYRHDIEEEDPPPRPTRREILESVGFRQLSFFRSPETETQAMLVRRVEDPVFAALVFRGTEQTLKDFVTDLQMGVEALVSDDVAVHEGFRLALDSVWPEIEEALADLSCPIFFTGHSLGGALATLAASRRAPKALYTFGCPRVGNSRFVKSLEGIPTFRIVDDWDLVTMVPPEMLGFRHGGELTRVVERSLRFSLNPVAWLKLMLSPAKRLADHAPVNYVDRL